MAYGSRLVTALAVVAALVAGAGCATDSGHEIDALRNPTVTTLEPFVEPHFDDTRGVALTAVTPGPPLAFPVTVLGGDASLSGSLTGPDGPVALGRVRLERFVGSSSASLDLTTNDRGLWKAKGIAGGRYRVRGWRMPDLAMDSSTTLFLGADDSLVGELAGPRQGGVDVQAALLTSSPTIAEPVTVGALVTRHEVDADGVVQGVPLSGTVATLSAAAGWEVTEPQAVVDADGGARWTLTCGRASPADLVVTADGRSVTVPAPSCNRPVAPASTVPPSSREPSADFPVGRRFTPPFDGPLPAGSYTVIESVTSCALVFERWVDGAWSADRATATGTDPFVLDTFARNLASLGAAPACTYERTA